MDLINGKARERGIFNWAEKEASGDRQNGRMKREWGKFWGSVGFGKTAVGRFGVDEGIYAGLWVAHSQQKVRPRATCERSGRGNQRL